MRNLKLHLNITFTLWDWLKQHLAQVAQRGQRYFPLLKIFNTWWDTALGSRWLCFFPHQQCCNSVIKLWAAEKYHHTCQPFCWSPCLPCIFKMWSFPVFKFEFHDIFSLCKLILDQQFHCSNTTLAQNTRLEGTSGIIWSNLTWQKHNVKMAQNPVQLNLKSV